MIEVTRRFALSSKEAREEKGTLNNAQVSWLGKRVLLGVKLLTAVPVCAWL